MSGYAKNENGVWVPMASADLWRSRETEGDDSDTAVVEVDDVDVDDDGHHYRRRVFVMPEHLRPRHELLGPDSVAYLVRAADALNQANTAEADRRRRVNRHYA